MYQQFKFTAMAGLALGLMTQLASAGQVKPFADLYAEGLRMSRVNTYAGYGQMRGGAFLFDYKAEAYGVARVGGDSRTLGDPADLVFNDNYAFVGAGFDIVGLPLPGLRFTNQIGLSFDLSDKINRQGFDFRTGLVTYHEANIRAVRMNNEFYSEWLYVHRYRNFIGNVQWRGYFQLLDIRRSNGSYHAGPLLWGSATGDTAGNDYNRIAEARAGARLGLSRGGRFTAYLAPHYVWGVRWGRPTTLPNYQDFRILLVGYFLI